MPPEYHIIPVCKEIYADVITPITLLRKIAAVSKRYYLLESVEGGEKWGRYSFLGFDPIMRVTCNSDKVTIETEERKEVKETKKPLEVIREILKEMKAPKIRACEIIEELETEQRGIYGGALGYIDFTGNMDTCIAIRMAVKKDGKVYVQAGGGIVADSIPENEYEESANKALAVMDAVKNAKEVLA